MRLDGLLNNAGTNRVGFMTEQSAEDLDAVMNLNVRALWLTSRAAIPALKRAETAEASAAASYDDAASDMTAFVFSSGDPLLIRFDDGQVILTLTAGLKQEGEDDILDRAFDVKESSRLSCQAEIGSDNLVVQISQESRKAYYDEHPDERGELSSEQLERLLAGCP